MAGMSGVATAAQAMGAKANAVVRTPEIPRVPYVPGELPGLELLEDPPAGVEGPSAEELTAEAQLLTTRMLDFGITGRVTEIHPGPVVTMFEFEPAAGVKVSQITSREDDLALAMRARQIRIIAPIPGKAAVGIEIPNRKPRTASAPRRGRSRSPSASTRGATRSVTTSRRCRTCSSPARPARARACT
jgi:DNA segregation ATPase FtsK/SpoIIIE-like protein